MKRQYLHSLDSRSALVRGGSKAKNLYFLIHHRLPVPPGWVLSWDALTDFQQYGQPVMQEIRRELALKIKPGQAYAVRSSASVEDDGDFSCAGLFHSFLGADSLDRIVDNILAVWKSLESDAFLAYQPGVADRVETVQMGVIIQEMVNPVCSGVAFSKNPLTGLSETIIEVGSGTADEQAQTKQNPERWVSKWGTWQQKHDKGLIDEQLASELVRQTAAIARLYGKPVDLEWAYDGHALHFLQVRPITQLDIPIFSNRIAKEMLPGIIKPLVWSVNTRLVNQIWVDILTRLTGDHSFEPADLTGHFYNRAYFNMAVFGRVFEQLGMPYESLELLFGLDLEGPDKPQMRPGMGIIGRMPRLIGFAISFLSVERRLKRLLQTKRQRYQSLEMQIKPDLPLEVWLELIEKVHDETRQVAYFNIMIPMMAMMYHRLLGKLLKKLGYDVRRLEMEGVAEFAARYNPHQALALLQQKYSSLNGAVSPDQAGQLEQDLTNFLDEFGHFSDSGNDCSSIPWRETPDLIRQMILRPGQTRSTEADQMTFSKLNMPWFRRPFIHLVYRRACRYAAHREAISSQYTYGYGQFRSCFMHLGNQLVALGVVEKRDDVFYLYWQELVDLIHSQDRSSQHNLIDRRRAEIESNRDAILPELIFGLEQPPLIKADETALRGIPTSLGTYTGPARILQGLKDFERLNHGDVLVIPFSDVGWTPLFSRAGAVVAESGGILSHSSIVAREYHIPAVVSVPGACRIRDGTVVTVNGYDGTVVVVNGYDETIMTDGDYISTIMMTGNDSEGILVGQAEGSGL